MQQLSQALQTRRPSDLMVWWWFKRSCKSQRPPSPLPPGTILLLNDPACSRQALNSCLSSGNCWQCWKAPFNSLLTCTPSTSFASLLLSGNNSCIFGQGHAPWALGPPLLCQKSVAQFDTCPVNLGCPVTSLLEQSILIIDPRIF